MNLKPSEQSIETRRRLAAIMRGVMPIPTETPELALEPVEYTRLDWNLSDGIDDDELEIERGV
jgi:hypothetical protein